jgi:hypothetical protein
MTGRDCTPVGRPGRLLRLFRHEQADLAQFSTPLARDTVAQVAASCAANGAIALDVGARTSASSSTKWACPRTR